MKENKSCSSLGRESEGGCNMQGGRDSLVWKRKKKRLDVKLNVRHELMTVERKCTGSPKREHGLLETLNPNARQGSP